MLFSRQFQTNQIKWRNSVPQIVISLSYYNHSFKIMNVRCWLVAFALMMGIAFGELLPKRLRVVDFNEASNNYFIRGSVPIDKNKKFQINELRSNLSQITLLRRYKLIVISLLNFLTTKETKLRYIQQDYFEKNPKVAQYRNRVVLGSILDPTEMPNWTAAILNKLGNFIDFDKIDQLLQEIYDQLHKKGNKNTIVYLHCQAGVDRTGYVAGAYRMKYLNKSLATVMQQNLDVLKGHRSYMVSYPQNGLQWFCYNLGKNQKLCEVPH